MSVKYSNHKRFKNNKSTKKMALMKGLIPQLSRVSVETLAYMALLTMSEFDIRASRQRSALAKANFAFQQYKEANS